MIKFLIIGNMNAITYKEIFPYIKNNELWLGNRGLGKDFFFGITDEYKDEIVKSKTQGGGWKVIDGEIMGRVANACWFTNIPHNKRNQPLDLYRKYNPTDYPMYDNYLAFNVDRVDEIPCDEYIDIEIDEEDYPKWKAAYGDDVEIIKENENNEKENKNT